MLAKSGPAETLVTIEGPARTLHGKVLAPAGPTKAALVAAHGRNGDMDEPLLAGLAGLAAELGLCTLRFTFAYQEAGAEPSAGHEDEIEDLRAAIDFARATSGHPRVIVAGRGLGAWAAVAAATDESAEEVILLGLSFTGQPERKVALERLDLPALHEVVRDMRTVQFVIVEGANHRLQDARHEAMTDVVFARCERWLRDRIG